MDANLNHNQSIIFDAIFNSDMSMKATCPFELAYWGGFGSGKSFITMLVAYHLCVKYPGSEILFTRYSYRQLMDSCESQFLALFPPHLYGYNYKKSDHELHFINGSKILYRAFDDPKKVLSNSYDGVVMCQAEELSEKHFSEVLGRLRGTKLPKRFVFTEGNPRRGWCKRRYHDNETPTDCLYIRATTYSNSENLPDGYIERMEQNYPPSYIKQYLEGSWDATRTNVYDQFKEHHKIPRQPLQDHWHIIIGLDHGTRVDTSIVFMAKTEHGQIFIFDEWHKSHPTVDEIVIACNRYGYGKPIIADYSMKVADRDYGSWWKDLQAKGLNLIECVKNKSGNILLINELFYKNKLCVFSDLSYVITQHEEYSYKDTEFDDSDKFEVIKKNDHSVDAVQYGIRYLHGVDVSSPADRFKIDTKKPTLHDYVTGRA